MTRKYTVDEIKKALKLSNIKCPNNYYSYDIEMCSEFFFEVLRELPVKKKKVKK